MLLHFNSLHSKMPSTFLKLIENTNVVFCTYAVGSWINHKYRKLGWPYNLYRNKIKSMSVKGKFEHTKFMFLGHAEKIVHFGTLYWIMFYFFKLYLKVDFSCSLNSIQQLSLVKGCCIWWRSVFCTRLLQNTFCGSLRMVSSGLNCYFNIFFSLLSCSSDIHVLFYHSIVLQAERIEMERVKQLTLNINNRLEEEDYQDQVLQVNSLKPNL